MAVPLAELTLSPRHHLSAIWWLCVLYRRPRLFVANASALKRLHWSRCFVILFHMLIHVLVLSAAIYLSASVFGWIVSIAVLAGIIITLIIVLIVLLYTQTVEKMVARWSSSKSVFFTTRNEPHADNDTTVLQSEQVVHNDIYEVAHLGGINSRFNVIVAIIISYIYL